MTPEARRRRRIRTPVLAVTAFAWGTLLLYTVTARPAPRSERMPAMPDMPGMVGMAGMSSGSRSGSWAPAHSVLLGSPLAFLVGWPLMLTAMMAPLLIPGLRHAHARSLPGRRPRTLALLVAGYALTWTAAGLVLQELAAGLRAGLRPSTATITVAVLAALAWQCSPVKQRCLNRHHGHPPLAAFGRAADLAAVRFGSRQAVWCIGSCWNLMLLPLLAGRWQLAVMATVTFWIWAELFDTPVKPNWRVRLPVRAVRIVAASVRSMLSGPTRIGAIGPQLVSR